MSTKSTLQKPRVKEIHSVYVDSLEKWIEIPVFEEQDLSRIYSQIDWSHQTDLDYKVLLVEHVDLESDVKASLRHPNVRNEIYNFIIAKNPGLKPKIASVSGQPYYTEQESSSVMEWFASHKIHGRKPEVISDEGER